MDIDRPPLHITVGVGADRIITVRPTGILTLRSSVFLRRVLEKCLADGPTAVIVDLSRLSFASIVLLTLFPTVARRHDNRHAIVLAAPRPEIRRWLRSAALGGVQVHDSVRGARARLSGVAPPHHRRELWLPPEPASAAAARRFAVTACDDWGLHHLAEPAAVVTTELVSNAVIHAGTAMRLTVTLRGAYLLIAVSDRGRGGTLPPASRPVPEAKSGRGLYLVEVYASTRGVLWWPDGKRVWASLRVQSTLDGRHEFEV